MVEKGIRGICDATHCYAKAYSKYMKDYDKNKQLLYLKCWDVNNLYRWARSKKLPVYAFEWVEETSQFNEDFIESYNEKSDKGYFLEVDVRNPEKSHELYNNLPLLTERMNIEKFEKLVANLHDKRECYSHLKI